MLAWIHVGPNNWDLSWISSRIYCNGKTGLEALLQHISEAPYRQFQGGILSSSRRTESFNIVVSTGEAPPDKKFGEGRSSQQFLTSSICGTKGELDHTDSMPVDLGIFSFSGSL